MCVLASVQEEDVRDKAETLASMLIRSVLRGTIVKLYSPYRILTEIVLTEFIETDNFRVKLLRIYTSIRK